MSYLKEARMLINTLNNENRITKTEYDILRDCVDYAESEMNDLHLCIDEMEIELGTLHAFINHFIENIELIVRDIKDELKKI